MQIIINEQEKTIVIFQPVSYTSMMRFLRSLDVNEYGDFTIHTARLEDLQQLNNVPITKPFAEA